MSGENIGHLQYHINSGQSPKLSPNRQTVKQLCNGEQL